MTYRPDDDVGSDSSGNAVVLRWSCRPGCVGLACREFRKALGGWGLSSTEEPANRVLSDILTDAVRQGHARNCGEIDARYLRIRDSQQRVVGALTDRWNDPLHLGPAASPRSPLDHPAPGRGYGPRRRHGPSRRPQRSGRTRRPCRHHRAMGNGSLRGESGRPDVADRGHLRFSPAGPAGERATGGRRHSVGDPGPCRRRLVAAVVESRLISAQGGCRFATVDRHSRGALGWARRPPSRRVRCAPVGNAAWDTLPQHSRRGYRPLCRRCRPGGGAA